MKRIHYDKFGDGRPVCGVAFAEYLTRDVMEVTCKRCRYSAEYTLSDIGWELLAKMLQLLFGGKRAGEHKFRDGRCRYCGCSETAVAHFRWQCR